MITALCARALDPILESEPGMIVVAEAANGREAVRLSEQFKPDIAIVDIAMPQLNGIDAVAQISKISPNTRSLILSMHSDETYILRALSAGAKGYILKDAAEDEILPDEVGFTGKVIFQSCDRENAT